MRLKILAPALLAAILLWAPLTVSVNRSVESLPELSSPAFFSHADYTAEPAVLGELLFTRADIKLSAREVREIAKGFAHLKRAKEDWIEKFVEGYQTRAEQQSSEHIPQTAPTSSNFPRPIVE